MATHNGSLRECVKRFAAEIDTLGSKRFEAIRAIAQLISVDRETFSSWLGGVVPAGINLLKLQTLLSCAGYHISDREILSQTQFRLATLLAFGFTTPSVVAAATGAHIDSALRWASGKVAPSGENETVLRRIADQYSDDVKKKHETWANVRILIGLDQPGARKHTSSLTALSSEKEIHIGLQEHDQTIQALGHLILAAIPLAERVLSDAFSEDDRRKLREITRRGHSHGVFDLSNQLNRLCGEKARGKL